METLRKYFLIIVLVYIRTSHCGWFVEKEDKCEFTANTDFIINFSEKPELFVNKIKTGSLNECQQSCCEHDTCNGYVWEISDVSENCKLLKCSSVGTDCKKALRPIAPRQSDNIPGHDKPMLEVGFITGINDNSAADETTTTTTPLPAINAANSDWLKQKLGLVSSSEKDEGISLSLKEETTTTPLPSSPKSPKTASTNAITTTKRPTSHKVTQKDTTVEVMNDDSPPKDTTTLSSVEKHYTHTNTVSLTVAFLFGMGFLVAAVAMLARRWFEGFRDANKRGYTRISYLLNGV